MADLKDVKGKPVEERWLDFMEELMSAVCLAGGVDDPEQWQDKTLKDVYTSLLPNGIELAFLITKDLRKIYGV